MKSDNKNMMKGKLSIVLCEIVENITIQDEKRDVM